MDREVEQIPEPAVDAELRTDRRRNDILRNAVVFLAVVAGGAVVRELQPILTPLVVATFLLILIDAFSRGVESRWPSCPEWLRLTMAAALTIAGFAGIVGVCVHYAHPFASEIAGLEPKLNGLLDRLAGLFQLPSMTLPEVVQGENPSSSLMRFFGAARGVVSRAVLVVIYLGFLLASRRAFTRKMLRLFPTTARRAHAELVFQSVRTATEQYMTLQTLKAALMAVAAVIVTTAVGLPNGPFWAFLLFLAAYIPIVGGIAGALVPTLVAFAEFDSPARPLALLVFLGGSIFLIDNVLMPKLQADRLNIDPVVVLLSLGFWGAVFGVAGVFLSTPLTVVVMAITAEFNGMRWLAVLLSRDGDPLNDRPAAESRPG